ncbi:hypothetical protein SAMN05216389_1424 [Oceanobacillus limi]|uniref:Uncharacterized protein n=1 Tax=Oceanobacillus limi TaxID=930131 RepID=A0A1I0HN73_9BACI|nr:hypothetical protein SAMN05216389_1424 [Oceanobacillus limi]
MNILKAILEPIKNLAITIIAAIIGLGLLYLAWSIFINQDASKFF